MSLYLIFFLIYYIIKKNRKIKITKCDLDGVPIEFGFNGNSTVYENIKLKEKLR